jgi:hypothetical protein
MGLPAHPWWMKNKAPLCHPDRSEAERRDLQFLSFAASSHAVSKDHHFLNYYGPK